LPCFEVKNVTSGRDGEKSILKSCFWKGKKINCAAIFKKVPTDQVYPLTILLYWVLINSCHKGGDLDFLTALIRPSNLKTTLRLVQFHPKGYMFSAGP